MTILFAGLRAWFRGVGESRLKKKVRVKARAKAKTKTNARGSSSPFDYAQGQNDKRLVNG
jgi:hypothetical protein